jgi:hypothetical protein
MVRPPARCGELSAELGHQRRPRCETSSEAKTSSVSRRHRPDPVALGLAPAPVTGSIPTPWSHRPADAARRPSADERSRRGEGKSPRVHGGLDSSGASSSRRRHSSEVELAVLNRRPVGTERFRRRRGSTVTVAVPNGDGGRTSKCGLVLLGRGRADTTRVNHPGAAKNRNTGPSRVSDNNATRRS